jgi:hypothetical protein
MREVDLDAGSWYYGTSILNMEVSGLWGRHEPIKYASIMFGIIGHKRIMT